MTRLLVMAGLSHRPPGLPGITPERTSPPLSLMGVTGLTPRTQVVGGLTNERQSPVPMPMEVVEYTPMPLGMTKNTQKTNPIPQAIGPDLPPSGH